MNHRDPVGNEQRHHHSSDGHDDHPQPRPGDGEPRQALALLRHRLPAKRSQNWLSCRYLGPTGIMAVQELRGGRDGGAGWPG